MNKNIIVGVIVVIVVLLAGYGWMNRGAADLNEDGDNAAATAGSFRSLLAMSGSQKCEFSQEAEGNESSGTVYVADGMMRGDFSTMMDGTAKIGHMIVKDEQVFVWVDGEAQGMKMMFSATAGATTTANQSPINLDDENVSYDCDRWSKDSSKFAEPSGVQFMDLSAIVGGGATTGGSGANPPQCAACESLQGTQKDQCRLALKCS